MALPTFAPPVAPSVGGPKSVQPRVLRAPFGDGYSQRTADGLNHMPATWDVKWDALTAAEADAVEAFFAARGGYAAFLWTAPDAAAALKYTCDSWTRTPVVGGEVLADRRFAISAKFTQVFDL